MERVYELIGTTTGVWISLGTLAVVYGLLLLQIYKRTRAHTEKDENRFSLGPGDIARVNLGENMTVTFSAVSEEGGFELLQNGIPIETRVHGSEIAVSDGNVVSNDTLLLKSGSDEVWFEISSDNATVEIQRAPKSWSEFILASVTFLLILGFMFLCGMAVIETYQ